MNKQIKNYLILIVILVITIVAVFYARNYYLQTKEYYSDNSVMLDVVREIHEDEINNYTLENPKFILYTASEQNENIKSFENSLKNFIATEQLNNDIIYLNLDETNKNKLKNTLKKIASSKLKNKITIDSAVSIYIVDNGQIIKVINNAQKYDINALEKQIKNYGVLTDD